MTKRAKSDLEERRAVYVSDPEEHNGTNQLITSEPIAGANDQGKSLTPPQLTTILRSELDTLQEDSRFNRNFLFSVLAIAFTLPLGICTLPHPEMFQYRWSELWYVPRPAICILSAWILGVLSMSFGAWLILPTGSAIENLATGGLADAMREGDIDRVNFNLRQKIDIGKQDRKRVLFSKWFFGGAFLTFLIAWIIQLVLIVNYVLPN